MAHEGQRTNARSRSWASRVAFVLAMAGGGLSVSFCGGDESDSWKCFPGDHEACDCPTGSPVFVGSIACGDDGTWSACDCVSCGHGSYKSVCAAGEYCCNDSCGICAAKFEACIMMACE